jgi:hypothetical protein
VFGVTIILTVGGDAAAVTLSTSVALAVPAFSVAVIRKLCAPSSAAVKARANATVDPESATMVLTPILSVPAKTDPSLVATATVDTGVPTGLLSGRETLAGVRVTEVGTGGDAILATVIAALVAATAKPLLRKNLTTYCPACAGTTR